MAKKSYEGPVDRLAAYDDVLDASGGWERKGAANPYTSLNGHMTSYIDRAGSVGLRLSPEDREAFIERYGTQLAEQYGRVMKDFVVVPGDLLNRTDELAEWFRRGGAWVSSLKPKPTRK